ncbi:MAG: Panacea domain-containing protein [Mesorhizobium sp.]
MERQKAEVVRLRPNVEKVVATIAYVVYSAEKLGRRFTQYDVVKSIFLADRAHLNEFGRLISTDKYVAMVHGPVPSTAYNLLKRDQIAMKVNGLDDLPWESEPGRQPKTVEFHSANVDWVDDYLSPSDKKAIESAVSTIKSLSFGQVRKLTHEDPAYIDAWEEGVERKQFPMSLAMLFDVPNFERARQLSEMSKLD